MVTFLEKTAMKLIALVYFVLSQVPLLLWSDSTENLLKLPCLSQVIMVSWPNFNPTRIGSGILGEFNSIKNAKYIPRINKQELDTLVKNKCGSVVEIAIEEENPLDQDQELKTKLRQLNFNDYIVMLTVNFAYPRVKTLDLQLKREPSI
jgi:hypothetical protein